MMREDLDKLLCERYHKIFRDRIHFDFSCGDGWFWLINNLCFDIQSHLDNWNGSWLKFKDKKDSYYFGKEEIPQAIALQVKEKLRGLRFYYSGGDDQIRGMVDFAESLSYEICEDCGSHKNIGCSSGWLATLCEECFNNRDDEWKQRNSPWTPRNTNCYDRYRRINNLESGQIIFYCNEQAKFIEHVNEYEKRIELPFDIKLGKEPELIVIDRRYLYLDPIKSD
jgi:hypothetical protein